MIRARCVGSVLSRGTLLLQPLTGWGDPSCAAGLVRCVGVCMQAFHASCIGLPGPDPEWWCAQCASGRMRCFACEPPPLPPLPLQHLTCMCMLSCALPWSGLT